MAPDRSELAAVQAHWQRDGLLPRVSQALAALLPEGGVATPTLLAPLDQFHGGGKPRTDALAALARFGVGDHVLDVGGGLGGPARTLAAQWGARVTVLDLTPSCIEVGRWLTERAQLINRVTFIQGNALALPFPDASFDGVWTQNSGMNIADKPALYAEFARVSRIGGRLALQEPVMGEGGAPRLPLMWSQDGQANHLWPAHELIAAIQAAGFDILDAQTSTPAPRSAAPEHMPVGVASIQELVMGSERLADLVASHDRNAAEGRIAMLQVVARRGRCVAGEPAR